MNLKITAIFKHIEKEFHKQFSLSKKICIKDVFEELEKVSNKFFKDTRERKYLNLDEKFLNSIHVKGNPICSFDTVLIDTKNRLCCIEFKNISEETLESIKHELKCKVGDTLLLFYTLNLNLLEKVIFYKPFMLIIYNEGKSKNKALNIGKVRALKHSLNNSLHITSESFMRIKILIKANIIPFLYRHRVISLIKWYSTQ